MPVARFQLFRLGDQWVSWRFIASNNRVVARGTEDALDAVSARALVHRLQQSVGRTSCSSQQDAQGHWRWTVQLHGHVVAESTRWYHRRVECESTLAGFRHHAASAPVLEGVKAFHVPADLRRGSALVVPAERRIVPSFRIGGLRDSAH